LLSAAATILVAPNEDDEPVTIYPPEKKRIREQLEKTERLEEEVRALREKNRRLQEELRRYKTCGPMLAASDRTSEAGSIPSSRVFYRRHVHKDPLPTGGQRGHPGRARERPIPNAAPLQLTLERCTDCGTRLGEPFEVRRRTITDLPPPKPLIFDVEIARYNCPGCRQRVEPECPFPRHQQYGFSLIARVVQLRLLGLSTAKIADYFEGAHGVPLSTAAVLKMERWAAESVAPLYESLKSQVADQAVIHADETKFRVGGENGWLWVFSHPEAVVYRIAPSRGQDVVLEVLDGARGTIVHDGWVPYDIVRTADHQFDLLHANRWLERAEILHRLEPRPLLREVAPKLTAAGPPPKEFLEFADGVRWLLRHAIEWSEHNREASEEERRLFDTSNALDDGRPPSEGVARPRGGSDRRRAGEAADESRYVPRRSGGGLAQQRGGDGNPSGSVVPKDQRGSEVVDGGVGAGAAAHDLPDMPEAEHVVCVSAQGRAIRQGRPGVRSSVSAATNLSSYLPRTPRHSSPRGLFRRPQQSRF
jgi:transposase